MLTAKAEDADVLQASKIGVDDYMMKPFNPEVLKAKSPEPDTPAGTPEEDIYKDVDVEAKRKVNRKRMGIMLRMILYSKLFMS